MVVPALIKLFDLIFILLTITDPDPIKTLFPILTFPFTILTYKYLANKKSH